MDRVEFIEQLQERLKETEERRDTLKGDCEKARKRTLAYINERFAETATNRQIRMADTIVAMNYVGTFDATGAQANTTEQIIRLGYQIVKAEKEIEELEEKLREYQSADVVKYIQELE